MIIIGIDIGGSSTKIIGVKDGVAMTPMQVEAADPITSVYGAFGRYMSERGILLSDVSQIRVTGVGATYIKDDIYHIPTVHVDEFKAIGIGGLRLSGLEKAIVVSMGTGTAFVYSDENMFYHMGGTGVGGGTIRGLCSRFIDVKNFDSIVELSESGDLSKIDLTIGDISSSKTNQYMSSTVTASNFGNMSDYAGKEDIALGIFNMVFQTIGMLAVFACKSEHTNDVVLSGKLSTVPSAAGLFAAIEELHGVRFHIPENSEYATAYGAAMI